MRSGLQLSREDLAQAELLNAKQAASVKLVCTAAAESPGSSENEQCFASLFTANLLLTDASSRDALKRMVMVWEGKFHKEGIPRTGCGI